MGKSDKMDDLVAQWPANSVEIVPIDTLVPYARNARTHSDEQVAQIASSMREWGWTIPCLTDESGGLIAGHGRILAGKLNGYTHVPRMVARGWSEAKKRAYVLADNQLALNAGWNDELLKLELADLKLEGFDLDLLGFGDGLTDLLDPDLSNPDKDPDAVPDVPENPHSKLGDVWTCGPHKIIVGDSTSHDTWDRLMGTELGDCVMTDPPFGVSYQAKGKKAIANDDLTGEKLRAFLAEVNTNLFVRLKPGSSVYMFHADTEGLAFRQSAVDAGFKVSQVLTWVKDSLVLGRSRYQYRHEPVLLLDKPGGRQRWWGGRKQTTVIEHGSAPFERLEDGRWAIKFGDEILVVDGEAKVESMLGSVVHHPKPRRSVQHPTMKPVSMLERLLKNSARQNDLVLEPFSGSGSTMMAAERLGMCARAVELDPGYVDVAVMRWQAYSGRSAVHADTGENFPVLPGDCEVF